MVDSNFQSPQLIGKMHDKRLSQKEINEREQQYQHEKYK